MLFFSFFFLSSHLNAERIYLKSGSQVKGEILKEQNDSVYVDLGFTVIKILRDKIAKIAKNENVSQKVEKKEDNIFYSIKNQQELTVRGNLKRCSESVVQIRTPVSLGSGFLIHRSGYVITNHHVISGEHKISVIIFQQKNNELKKIEFKNVRIVAMNPDADIALLKVETKEKTPFKTVPLGTWEEMKQGQEVFAIGSPLGLDRSVSKGIISLKNRLLDNKIYIQTTTQINPGNSGGPLFNLKGEVIGITNMKTTGAAVEGIGYAIPINLVKYFIKNRDAFAFDPRNPNAGYKYFSPPNKKGIKK